MFHTKTGIRLTFSRFEAQLSEQLRLSALLPAIKGFPALNLYYRHLFRCVCRILRHHTALFPGEAPQTLTLISDISFESDRLLSVVCRLTAQSKELIRIACVWSKQSGFPLRLSSFAGKKRNILALVREETASRLRSGRYLYFPDAVNLSERYYRADNFYLDADGPILFYPPQTIASEIEGFPEFRLVFPASS